MSAPTPPAPPQVQTATFIGSDGRLYSFVRITH